MRRDESKFKLGFVIVLVVIAIIMASTASFGFMASGIQIFADDENTSSEATQTEAQVEWPTQTPTPNDTASGP
jgi:hypothetical protein